jgi:hypothetical protein
MSGWARLGHVISVYARLFQDRFDKAMFVLVRRGKFWLCLFRSR